MSRVIQVSTNTMGDNNTCEMKMFTTLLYDDGRVFEGSSEVVSGEYGSFVYGMVWNELELPVIQPIGKE